MRMNCRVKPRKQPIGGVAPNGRVTQVSVCYVTEPGVASFQGGAGKFRGSR